MAAVIAARLPDGWQRLVDPAWLSGWTPRPFALPGGETRVLVTGAGPTLVLLPPLPGYKEAWLGVTSLLRERFRVVTFDLRVRFATRDPWREQLEDLERIADAFAPGACFVAGHSLGGALAQRGTLARPERVARLALSSSFAEIGGTARHWRTRYVEQLLVLAGQRFLPEPIAAALARRHAGRGEWVFDERCDAHVLAFVRHAIRHQSVRHAAACIAQARRHDTRASLPRLARPTLIVVGARESEWARRKSDDLARLIPCAARREAPGVGHLHPLSHPEWLAATIAEWMEACEPARAVSP